MMGWIIKNPIAQKKKKKKKKKKQLRSSGYSNKLVVVTNSFLFDLHTLQVLA